MPNPKFQRFRTLTNGGWNDLIAYLLRQIDATLEAEALINNVADSSMEVERATELMRTTEHRGDKARAGLVVALSHVFSTPIDREDLFRLSRSIDDVLDNLRDFLREVRLFAPKDLTLCRPLLPPINDSLRYLREGVVSIQHNGIHVDDSTLATRKAGNLIRRGYQQSLATLFNLPIDSETLKQRELLRRLDIVGLRLSEAADALADGWLKRGR